MLCCSTRWVLSLALCVTLSGFAVAQDKLPTAEEVMANCAKATAPADKLKSLKSMTIKSKISIPNFNMNGTMEATNAAGGKGVIKVDIAGQSQVIGTDGTKAWMKGPAGAQVVEGSQGDMIRFQACLLPMVDYAKYFKSVKCTARKNFKDQECYELECQASEGEPLLIYFSVKTGLMAGMVTSAETPMGPIEIEVAMSDYKDVDGYKWSHKSVSTLPGGIEQVSEVESIEINKAIDEKEFAAPK